MNIKNHSSIDCRLRDSSHAFCFVFTVLALHTLPYLSPQIARSVCGQGVVGTTENGMLMVATAGHICPMVVASPDR